MISKMVAQGMQIKGVPTSQRSRQQAEESQIPLLDEFDTIDVSIDGADEVDPRGNLIKGGWGAHTHEKIVAFACRKRIIVCDDSKLVKCLGKFPLPVEVLQFGWQNAKNSLAILGCTASLRLDGESRFLTDNKHYVLDCAFAAIPDPAALSKEINAIPGVVENGLFCGLTDIVIVGHADGTTEEMLF
jgi:ribose 5-phosphate isomerase A